MLTTAEFENYRGFERFRLAGLRRVNLLVGKNNCGKTSVLEGIQLLASGGDPVVLERQASRRGERVFDLDIRHDARREVTIDTSHFFHGHGFDLGASFSIRADNGLGELVVRVVPAEDAESQRRFFDYVRSEWALRIDYRGYLLAAKVQTIPVDEGGGLPLPEDVFRLEYRTPRDRDELPPVQMVSPYVTQARSLSAMWNKIVVDARESEVVRALQIVEPTLTDIFFLSPEDVPRNRDTIVAAFAGERKRIPLGSHGDGMRRLLEISIALTQASNGFLLIDEIDTGLHYSIMGDMWLLVANAARQADINVFATTHSLVLCHT